MEAVEGWLFYKASGAYHFQTPFLWMVQEHQHSKLFLSLSVFAGGHGRRKLLAIPPDVDGYTGRLIRSVSGAGKTTMYIVPLQQDLDLTPLPSDATEFQKMPKAACQVCKENMPLHILALHIEGCMESAADDDDDEVNAYNRRYGKTVHIFGNHSVINGKIPSHCFVYGNTV